MTDFHISPVVIHHFEGLFEFNIIRHPGRVGNVKR